MNYTRVDPKKLAAAIERARVLIQQADDAVDDLLVLLTPEARGELPRPRDGFAGAARAVAQSGDLDELKKMASFDEASVLEDLANVEALAKVEPALAKLQQRVSDSRLLWLAEAYGMTMDLYGLARARAKSDPAVAKAIEPLAELLATPRLKKKTP